MPLGCLAGAGVSPDPRADGPLRVADRAPVPAIAGDRPPRLVCADLTCRTCTVARPPRIAAGTKRLSAQDQPIYDDSRAFPLGAGTQRGAARELFRLALGEHQAIDDPATTVAIALQDRFWVEVVEPALAATVDRDGVELLRYALDLPRWQAEHGLPVDYSTFPFEEKLMWAGRGEESVFYGALNLLEQAELLNEVRYRFNAYTAADLAHYRELFLAANFPTTSLAALVGAMDDWGWSNLHYCATAELMDRWCADNTLDQQTCTYWSQDKAAGNLTLGTVDGVAVDNDQGMSPSYQYAYFEQHGYFKGDCGTHTTITMALYRSIGLAASGMQYLPRDPSLDLATHNFPIFYDPGRQVWGAYQLPTEVQPQTAPAVTFYFYPVRDPMAYLLFHFDADSLAVGVALHSSASTTYGDLAAMLQAGIARDEWRRDFWAAYPTADLGGAGYHRAPRPLLTRASPTRAGVVAPPALTSGRAFARRRAP